MDGNGRWAQRRSPPRTAGHRGRRGHRHRHHRRRPGPAGVEWLSLHAFSTENRNRPGAEVDYLMRLVRRVVRKHAPLLLARGIRCRLYRGRGLGASLTGWPGLRRPHER
ncbi:undecaprenyl diphosphate synthase family protein [Streptomyces thinghirensis]|nr:undecaprenyl diphosphate synthase family protein [Streptomyces thinghirensis]